MALKYHPDKCLSPEERQVSIELSKKIKNKEPLSQLEKEQEIKIRKKTENFVNIDKAYKVLSDQEEKRRYDNNQHSSNDTSSKNQQYSNQEEKRYYDDFWNIFEEYCDTWSKLIRTGTLFTTIELGSLQECSSLIKEGVNVNVRHDGSNKYIPEWYLGLTPVDLTIQKNQDLILNLLIENGAEVPDDALISAVKHDAQKVFNFLLGRNDIDINYQDEDGNTALHHVFKGYVNGSFNYSDSKWELKYNGFAESLLGKGAQFDIKNKNGVTSFDLFIDSIIRNKNGISFYNNAVNKESIDTYHINVKQRGRLGLISKLFVNRGIDQLKCKNDKPAFKLPQYVSIKRKVMYGIMLASPFLAVGIYALVTGGAIFNPMTATGIFVGAVMAAAILFTAVKIYEKKAENPDMGVGTAVKEAFSTLWSSHRPTHPKTNSSHRPWF